MVLADACTRSFVRSLGVCMGVQLGRSTETFQRLSLGLQQFAVERFWLDNFAVFSGVVHSKFVSRISGGISTGAY